MTHNIKESKFPGRTYLVWRKQIETSNITDDAMWKSAFGMVAKETEAKSLKVNGPAAALYFSWDENAGMADFAIGLPIENAEDVSDPELSLVTVPESDASVTTVMGPYEGLREAHGALWKYTSEKELNPSLTIEEYEITDYETHNIDDWKTNLYYLHD